MRGVTGQEGREIGEGREEGRGIINDNNDNNCGILLNEAVLAKIEARLCSLYI